MQFIKILNIFINFNMCEHVKKNYYKIKKKKKKKKKWGFLHIYKTHENSMNWVKSEKT
jgi:ribosomal protein S11